MQHFVEENVFDRKFRNAATVHAAVQDDLVRARIVTTELAPPTACAPTDVWAAQLARKVFSIETIEEDREIVVTPLRRDMREACAMAAHAADAATSPARTRIQKVRLNQSTINAPAIDTREKQSGSPFQHLEGARRSRSEKRTSRMSSRRRTVSTRLLYG